MPRLLGEVEIYEENLQLEIYIFREGWVEHLALLGGINIFWIILFKSILSCYKKNQF